VPQPAYYSERKVINPTRLLNESVPYVLSLSEFLGALEKDSSLKYVIITFSEPNYPPWMRQETYAQASNGQTVYATWQIPFMNTTIDFLNGQQNIAQSITYGNITFELLTIKQDAFVYGIDRN